MIWALVSTCIDAFASITRKKSLELNTYLSAYGFKILWMFGPLIFVPYFLFQNKYSFQKLNLGLIFAILCICLVRIVSTNLSQYIYKNEKVTVLMPYENLNKVMSIIASFFLLWDGNIKTVWVAFIVIVILLIASLDFQKITFPQIFALLFLHESLTATRSISTAYIIKMLSSYVDYFIIESGILILFLVIWTIVYKDLDKFSLMTKKFYSYRVFAGVLGTMSYVIGLYLISSLGLVLTILLSFLWITVKLILWYFVLHDRVQIKNIFLAVTITGLVSLWFLVR